MESPGIIFHVAPSGLVLAKENKIQNVVFALPALFIWQARIFWVRPVKRERAEQNVSLVLLYHAVFTSLAEHWFAFMLLHGFFYTEYN